MNFLVRLGYVLLSLLLLVAAVFGGTILAIIGGILACVAGGCFLIYFIYCLLRS